MDLLNYVKANGDLSGLPNGLHAVVPPNVEKGLQAKAFDICIVGCERSSGTALFWL